MMLLDRILAGGVQLPVDPIIAARVERHLQRIQPDPMFRSHLRGQVLNRYVANREGMLGPASPTSPAPVASRRRDMGALGRGVLVASLATALSASAVGAAAQESLPGDALYSVKLQLEELRIRLAPPLLRDDLAAMALDERLEEVEQLATAGRWELVGEAAAGAARAEEQLAALTNGPTQDAQDRNRGETINDHADRLEQLIATAPASAQDSLLRAVDASTSETPPALEPPAADPPTAPPSPNPNPGGQPPKDSEPAESAAEKPAESPAEALKQRP
jgi:hypothetical protein